MRCYNRTVKSSCPLLESLEARMLFAAILPQVTVTARAAAAYEGGPATRFFYIRRSGETSQPLSVFYTVGGKAKQGLDYNAVGNGITIKPGTWLRRVEVTAIDDHLLENTESITLTLNAAAQYAVGPTAPAATIRIIDNDQPATEQPVVSVSAPTEHAAESGPTARSFKLTRSGGDLSLPLNVIFSTAGTAQSGIDYTPILSSTVIPAGQVSADVTVVPIDDQVHEDAETVVLTLGNDAGYLLGNSTATISIDDNDAAPVADGTLSWNSVAPMPIGRSEAMGAVIDGNAYLLGGFHDYSTVPTEEMDRYDPASNTWMRVADIPVPLSHAGVAVDGHFMYVAGGYPANAAHTAQLYGTNVVRRYNALIDTWDTIQSLPQARATGALVIVNHVLHWVAGADLTRADRSEHWSLDLTDPSATWTTRAPIPTARNHCGHIALNGKIYIIGGAMLQDAAETPLASMEIYDPATDEWMSGPSMPVARALIQSAVAVQNGKIYVAGGETAFERPTDQVTCFDPSANKWAIVTSLPSKRLAPVLLTLGSDDLLCMGGYYNQFNTTGWSGTFV
jgi:N-acetylneuraminic acid mutarotase